MSKLITVIGPSGIGKTALVQALSETGQFATAYEQHAERPFQAAAKQDSRYVFANQMDYLILRAEQERKLRTSSKVGIIDGGLDLDFHGFTHLFLSRNLLSQNEFELCRRFYLLTRELLPLPELIIRLKADDKTVAGRLSGRNRVNIANVDDTAIFNSYLDKWLTKIPSHQLLELDVSKETIDYTNSIKIILDTINQTL